MRLLMLLAEPQCILRGDSMKGKREGSYRKWLATFSKKAVAIILTVSLIDLQISYILAFLGKEQIAETLSTTIADTIVGVMLGYILKALFETFFEKREERLNKLNETDEIETEGENI